MTTDRANQKDRLTMPGGEPTDEDLRHDVELTRQELAETVAALGAKADVKARMRVASRQRVEAIQARGEELVDRLPEPMAARLQPLWVSMSHRPTIPLVWLVMLLALFRLWLRLRRHY